MAAPPRVLGVTLTGADEISAALENQVSKGGWFYPTDAPDPRGTKVVVAFSLPGLPEPLEVPGEVAFAAPATAPVPGLGAGMAIQFTRLTGQLTNAFQSAAVIARSETTGPRPAADTASPAEAGETLAGNEDDGPLEEPDEPTQSQILARLNSQTSENLYKILRPMPLHMKVVAAKRGNRAVRALLIQEGNKKIMTFLLQNPQITIPEIITMIKVPTISQEVLQLIAKNANWSQTEDVRFALVMHPKTPLPLCLTLLPSLNVNSLAKLAKTGSSKPQVKSTALRLLQERRK